MKGGSTTGSGRGPRLARSRPRSRARLSIVEYSRGGRGFYQASPPSGAPVKEKAVEKEGLPGGGHLEVSPQPGGAAAEDDGQEYPQKGQGYAQGLAGEVACQWEGGEGNRHAQGQAPAVGALPEADQERQAQGYQGETEGRWGQGEGHGDTGAVAPAPGAEEGEGPHLAQDHHQPRQRYPTRPQAKGPPHQDRNGPLGQVAQNGQDSSPSRPLPEGNMQVGLLPQVHSPQPPQQIDLGQGAQQVGTYGQEDDGKHLVFGVVGQAHHARPGVDTHHRGELGKIQLLGLELPDDFFPEGEGRLQGVGVEDGDMEWPLSPCSLPPNLPEAGKGLLSGVDPLQKPHLPSGEGEDGLYLEEGGGPGWHLGHPAPPWPGNGGD